MAIKLKESSEFIEVISRLDECVTCTDDDYESYLEDLDEKKLCLVLDGESDPVRFVMRTELDYKAQRQIKKDQVSVSKEGGMGVNMGFTMLEVRLCLTDIKNPGSDKLKYSKDSDGYASQDLIARLDAYGILQDLYSARQNTLKSKVSKKN